jgi:putative transposase
VIVETLGLPLAVFVHPASEHDSQTGPSVLKQLPEKSPRLKRIFADGGCKGLRDELLQGCFQLPSIVEPKEANPGFDSLSKR